MLHIAVFDSLVLVLTGSSVRTPSTMIAYRNAPAGTGAAVVNAQTPFSSFANTVAPGDPGV